MVKPRCPVCRSKKWRRDRASGMVVCEEGHILSGYLQEDNEVDGMPAHTTRTRKLRKNKTKRKRRTADPNLYHGSKLRFLFFQCAQIILRKQIKALINIWDLPPELETVARDLWAMYVSLTDLQPEPFLHGQDDVMQSSPSSSPMKGDAPLEDIVEQLSTSEEEDEDDDVATDAEQDPDSMPQSQPEVAAFRQRKKRSPYDPAKNFRLEYTLVICYLSCLTLRIPVLMKDILDLAAGLKIDYIEVLSSIPEDMRKHLQPQLTELQLLDSHVPEVMRIQGSQARKAFAEQVTHFARMLHKNYAITFPEINAAPLLWRCVREAGLPPFIYVTARRLLIAVEADLALAYRADSQILTFPDAELASSMIASVKLVWGADGRPMIPQDEMDMGAALPRFEPWLAFAERLQRELPDTCMPKGARCQSMTELNKDEIDEYLNFVQNGLITGINKEPLLLGTLPQPANLGKAADRFFTLHPLSEVATPPQNRLALQAEQIQKFYSSCSTPVPGEAVDEDPLFLGQGYTIWNSTDREGVAHPDFDRVLAIVGNTVGIKGTALQGPVMRFERALTKAQTAQKVEARKRTSRQDKGDVSDSDDSA